MKRMAVLVLLQICCWQLACSKGTSPRVDGAPDGAGKGSDASTTDLASDLREPTDQPIARSDGSILFADTGSPDVAPGQPDTEADRPVEQDVGTVPLVPDASVDQAPLPGPTLYAMSAQLAGTGGSSGTSFPPAGMSLPSNDSFSLLVDWQAGTATTGANGSTAQMKIKQGGDGNWEGQGPLILHRSLTDSISFSYGHFKIRPMGNGCTATADGIYNGRSDDMYFTKSFTATLQGVPDRAGPSLQWLPSGTVHPLRFSGVTMDELMPANTTAVLRASPDVTVEILPRSGFDNSIGVSGFLLGQKALAFGTTYSLEIRPAAVDLAGNRADQLATLTTTRDPGLFAQDGFEGPVKALMAGDTVIADNTTLPIPTGKKALVLPPASGICSAGVTFRLAALATAKAVKFSSLTYHRKNYSLAGGFTFTTAVPHGDLLRTNSGVAKTTVLPKPWTGDLPGSSDYTFGDLKEVELPVPAGVGKEIIFDIQMIACGTGASPFHGLIVDDLRVE